MKPKQTNDQLIGILSAACAYTLWGLLPVYWKLIDEVPPLEVLAHRIIWSFLFMLLLLLVIRKWKAFQLELREIISQPPKACGTLIASTLISVNWFTYIWAVSNNRVVEASLGYYINPLVSVLLGIIFLKEKLSLWQMVSFFLAATGVFNLVFHFGAVPWVALVLAMSFGLYGLSKKVVNVGAATGLTLETLLVTPVALIYLARVHAGGAGAFDFASPAVALLLVGAGAVTAVPLLLFATGAKRLPLYAVGFLQYIAPTLMLILGVFLYHEPFTAVHLASFILIWTALTVFSLSRTAPFMQLESMVLRKTQKVEKKV